ncbi:MAG: ABC transporter permease, partial [Vicinamibacteria bacterium]
WYDEDPPRSRRFLTVLARLKDGATVDDAMAEVGVLAHRIELEAKTEAPEYESFRLSVRPFLDVWAGFVGPAAYLLMGAAGLALAIACGNIAGLLLARGASRRHEIAVRRALGAPRGRLVGHLLAESILLATLGGAFAVVIAHLALETTARHLPSQLPLMGIELEIDATVFAYNAGVSLLSALLFGLVPAIQSARMAVPTNLAPENRAMGALGTVRMRRLFVATQIAASMVLLTGAALLLRSFERLSSIDPGVSLENVLTMRVTLPWERYEGKLDSFFRRWLEEVKEIPGVRAAGLTTQFPPMVFVRQRIEIEGRAEEIAEELSATYDTVASPGLFEALGMTLVRGRLFDDLDTRESPLVAVVNQSFARRYFSGEDPLGRPVRVGDDEDEARSLTIVGIVSDARNRGLDQEYAPELWSSYRQRGEWNNQMHLVLRTESDPALVLPAVREA